eukprot:PRCOL_00007096-RA
MSSEAAREILGVKRDASFDNIVRAKNQLLRGSVGDDRKAEVEMAYDILLMASLSRRQSGVTTNSQVKYADVVPELTPADRAAKALGKLGVRAPEQYPLGPATAPTAAAVFGGLSVWVLLASFGVPAQYEGLSDVWALQVGLGLAGSVYLLKSEKYTALPRAAALGAGALVAGALAGSVVSGLAGDGLITRPVTFSAETSLIALYLTTQYLR